MAAEAAAATAAEAVAAEAVAMAAAARAATASSTTMTAAPTVPSAAPAPAAHNRVGPPLFEYEQQQHCAGGRVVAGHEWAVGESYEFPERKCCACGGGKWH